METFRRKLKVRIIWLAAVILVMFLVSVCCLFPADVPDYMTTFTAGASSGLLLFLMIRLIIAAVSLPSP